MTRPCLGPIGEKGRWNTPRPLDGPTTHIHGGLDIVAPVGEPLVACKAATVYRFAIYRMPPGDAWWRWPLLDGGYGREIRGGQ